MREIYARQGDELQVGLDGAGFLFLGFPDRSPLADGMSFKGKENRNGKTWFTFQALKLGTYDLDFLQQENTTGKIRQGDGAGPRGLGAGVHRRGEPAAGQPAEAPDP